MSGEEDKTIDPAPWDPSEHTAAENLDFVNRERPGDSPRPKSPDDLRAEREYRIKGAKQTSPRRDKFAPPLSGDLPDPRR